VCMCGGGMCGGVGGLRGGWVGGKA
jgi:hypothetical protein